MITIKPATIDMVQAGRSGGVFVIDADVCGVAEQLKEIDPRLELRYYEEGGYFAVVLLGAALHGRPHLVTTCQELHGGLVEHVRRLASDRYDPGQAGDLIDREEDRKLDKEFSEKAGNLAEKLSHAIKSDLKKGRPGPVYIPPDRY